MNSFLSIRGDKFIWAITAILAIFSCLAVYSASSNLALYQNKGNTTIYFIRHGIHLILGFGILYIVHFLNFRWWKKISILLLVFTIILLAITLFQTTIIAGANASRWIKIPLVGISFQTSSLASVSLLMYCASYLSKIKDKKISFKQIFVPLVLPIFLVCGLIIPPNFSTAALIFSMVIALLFIAKLKWSYILYIIGIALISFSIFVLSAMAFPNMIPNRIDTWKSRLKIGNKTEVDDYQVEKARMAIATSPIFWIRPGKSTLKNTLPQASSDFIFTVIVQEWSLIGGSIIIFIYMLLLFRFIRVASKTSNYFGMLLTAALGLPIIAFAITNIGVAVGLLPVTGQNLPLISSGGTSIYMTCFSIGIILSVSRSFIEKEIEMSTDEDSPFIFESK